MENMINMELKSKPVKSPEHKLRVNKVWRAWLIVLPRGLTRTLFLTCLNEYLSLSLPFVSNDDMVSGLMFRKHSQGL